jgi:hypothetical protein
VDAPLKLAPLDHRSVKLALAPLTGMHPLVHLLLSLERTAQGTEQQNGEHDCKQLEAVIVPEGTKLYQDHEL